MIIGISGKRGVGKTSLANYICKSFKFTKLSFAEELKELAKSIFPFTEVDLNSVTRKEKRFKEFEFSPREFMTNFGDFIRYHDKDYWVKKAISKCESNKLDYIFDDVRFENEAEAIRAIGGKLIRIERYEKHNPYGKNLDISSETSLDKYKFDFVIPEVQNVAIESLYKQGSIAYTEFEGELDGETKEDA